MKILISGSHGFIGRHLTDALARADHVVHPLIRTNRIALRGQVVWNPVDSYIQRSRLEGLDAVIHLAGENIFGRWTQAKQQRIYSSRVPATQFLIRTLAELNTPPKTLLCASAIGWYGSRGEEILTERSEPGSGFLADLCRDWEAACKPAADAGIRAVHLRFGMVLDPSGGALAKMLPVFRLGLGGPLSDGTQWQSWISLPDCLRAIEYLLEHDTITGPVNLTAPESVQNRNFTTALAKALKRPAVLPVPAWALRLIFGPMTDQLLLASARVIPQKLKEHGFVFTHPSLEAAFTNLFLKPEKETHP